MKLLHKSPFVTSDNN